MIELGMGGLLGVAKGSAQPPQFIVLSYRGDPSSDKGVGLVGKGKIDLFLPKGTENCPSATVTYRGPLRPPVQAGQEVGKLTIF